MKRTIIEIDRDKCNGCGLCVDACHEGALAMVDGKAMLVSDSYCDGLGHCLPQCPVDAIHLIEREAQAYDEELVQERMKEKENKQKAPGGCPSVQAKTLHIGGGCPSAQVKTILREGFPAKMAQLQPNPATAQSELRSWPIQIQLVPVNAPYFDGAHLLIAADCTAFAYANIHEEFMKGKITLIGCPKLDAANYAEKLGAILAQNDIQSVTVLRMEVPCCGGIVHAVQEALKLSGKTIPWGYAIVTTDGALAQRV
ncbi:4Fe-4S binding protein [Oscillospiraceae bacterium MB08-C2-2]|nr:4Fe-4S binding protein [Oscillospiraceae bacterium MB08-C2-2]